MGKRNFRPFVGGTSILTRMAACRRGGEGRLGKIGRTDWADREKRCIWHFKKRKKEEKAACRRGGEGRLGKIGRTDWTGREKRCVWHLRKRKKNGRGDRRGGEEGLGKIGRTG